MYKRREGERARDGIDCVMIDHEIKQTIDYVS